LARPERHLLPPRFESRDACIFGGERVWPALPPVFVQILRKLQFFKLSERSRKILVDYCSNCLLPTNANFKTGDYHAQHGRK
jgi:hypothetical protein